MMAKILGKRIVICAQTIGPFTGLMHGRLAAAVLNLADLIIVREKKTAALLEEIGVKKFHVTADIVFTFPAPKKSPRKKRILICAERLDSLRQRKPYAEYLGRLGKRIVDEFGCEVLCMPANRADVDFQKEIITGLDGKISAIGEVQAPGKVAELASESEFLISSRMHPIILGTLSATPFFAIGDSFKFEEVLGVFCKGCTLKINELDDKSIETILERIREREKLGKMIAAKLPDAREKALENGSILRRSFKEWNLK
jgi:polysaccharide pyruvyl transferase WcaK-like protein